MARVIHISESHHWYSADGEPVWEVPSADGKGKVEPTLREARKFGLLPGATAINKQIANPFLETWKEENALRNAFNTRPKDGETADEYVKRVSWLAGQYARDAAETGKLLHKDIEEFFFNGSYPVGAAGQAAVDAISKWLKAEGYDVFKPEAAFGKRHLGWGGRVDLLASSKDRGYAILDFKTCDLAKIRQPYESWGWQLAAYKAGLELPNESRLVSVPIDRATGATKFMEWDADKHYALLDVFNCSFEIWCHRKSYDPRSWKAE